VHKGVQGLRFVVLEMWCESYGSSTIKDNLIQFSNLKIIQNSQILHYKSKYYKTKFVHLSLQRAFQWYRELWIRSQDIQQTKQTKQTNKQISLRTKLMCPMSLPYWKQK